MKKFSWMFVMVIILITTQLMAEANEEKATSSITPKPTIIRNYSLDETNELGVTKLILAARTGDLKEAEHLLNEGAYIDAPDEEGATPLIHAAEHGSLEMVEFLLKNGADPNSITYYDSDYPHFCKKYGWYDCYNKKGKSPLNGALISKSARIRKVKLLLENRANPNMRVGPTEKTPLMFAIDHPEIIQLLLDYGANPNLTDNIGCTPILDAIQHGASDEVLKKLTTKENVNIEDENRKTPLYESVLSGRKSMAKYFLSIGAKAHEDFLTMVMNEREDDLKKLKRMISWKIGVDINTPNSIGITPLMVAIRLKDIRMVRFLLKKGAKIDQRDKRNNTPLMHLAMDCSETYHHSGYREKYKKRYLSSCWTGDQGHVWEIYCYNTKTVTRYTPSTQEKLISIARLLINKGDKKTAVNDDGMTTIMLLKENHPDKCAEVEKFLLKKGVQ